MTFLCIIDYDNVFCYNDERIEMSFMKKYLFILLLIIVAFASKNVYASNEYLPINYKVIRYNQDDNTTGTTIWWAKIPAKYKMHYAYGEDKIFGKEETSKNAIRHNATLAVNAQYMGLVDYNGQLLAKDSDVSNYDFYLKPNTVDSLDQANVYATKKTAANVGIDLSNIIDPVWTNRMTYMRVIINGSRVNTDIDRYKDAHNGEDNLTIVRHPRTWLVIDNEGNQYVAVCAGRGEPLNGDDFTLPQAGLTYDEIISVTRTYFTNDIKHLFNLDGGGSSTFVYKGEMLNPKYDDSEHRFTIERKVKGMYYWKVDNYNIEYDLDGGKLDNKSNPKTYNVDSESFTLNNPAKDGYEFVGWIETIDGNKNDNVKKEITINPQVIGDRKYQAVYKLIDNNKQIIEIENTSKKRSVYIIIAGIIILCLGISVFLYQFRKKNV